MDMNQSEPTVLVKVTMPTTEPTTDVVTTPTPTPTVQVTAPNGATTRVVSLLPKYATTPKRNAQRMKREPEKLLAHVLEHGPVVELTPDVYALLEQRGLPKHRVVNAVSDLKKYYGIQITAARTGRTVTRYTFAL